MNAQEILAVMDAEIASLGWEEMRKARAAVAALIAERDALRDRVDKLEADGVHSCGLHCQRIACVLRREVERLRRDCAEAYQVVGAGMLGEPCSYTQADVERALDNLSAAANGEPRPHDDLLPWPRATAAALTRAQGVQS